MTISRFAKQICNKMLDALKQKLEERIGQEKVSSNELVSMAEFVLKNNYFEFNGSIKHQISGTAIGTKFAPPYACIFMVGWRARFWEKKNLNLGYGFVILMISFLYEPEEKVNWFHFLNA